jgi:hypothetical protein
MTYHPSKIPSEVLFSSWVFYWVTLYYTIRVFFPSIRLNWCDPIFAILFALSYQFYAFIHILFRVHPLSKLIRVLVKFSIITILFKLIPLYLVWDPNVIWINSILSFLIVFSIYFAYIRFRRIDLLEIYYDLTESYVSDDNRIQFYRFLHNARIIA